MRSGEGIPRNRELDGGIATSIGRADREILAAKIDVHPRIRKQPGYLEGHPIPAPRLSRCDRAGRKIRWHQRDKLAILIRLQPVCCPYGNIMRER